MRVWPPPVLLVAARRDDILDLSARRRVYETVRSYPGLHLRELARHAGLETNHAKYHLRHLEGHGLVSSRKEDGYWRFFPREEGSLGLRDALAAREKKWLSLLRREVPLHIVTRLLGQDEATQSELADAVGVARGTMHYHLKKLEDAGIIESRRHGRERLYRVLEPEHLMDLLTRFRPPRSLVEGFLEAWRPLRLPSPRQDGPVEQQEDAHIEEDADGQDGLAPVGDEEERDAQHQALDEEEKEAAG